jgi:hypothetical protein
MFERIFLGAMRWAARLLFVAALVMLVWGIGFSIDELSRPRGESVVGIGGRAWGLMDTLLIIISTAFDRAAKLFFGAAILYYLEVWTSQRQRT